MCWKTNNCRYAEKKIAEEDIEVFKIVKLGDREPEDREKVKKSELNVFYSIYNGFPYRIGETYRENINLSYRLNSSLYEWAGYKITHGFHSYSKNLCHICLDGYIFIIRAQNFDIDWFFSDNDIVKLNCIIPKGSEYYENEHGEIVSNYLKIVSFEKIV